MPEVTPIFSKTTNKKMVLPSSVFRFTSPCPALFRWSNKKTSRVARGPCGLSIVLLSVFQHRTIKESSHAHSADVFTVGDFYETPIVALPEKESFLDPKRKVTRCRHDFKVLAYHSNGCQVFGSAPAPHSSYSERHRSRFLFR